MASSPSARSLVLVGILVPASYTLFGNLGVLTCGTMGRSKVPPLQRVDAWAQFYKIGMVHFFVPFAATIPAWAWLAYTHTAPLDFRWALAGLAASTAVLPWSASMMLPINKQLLKIDADHDEITASTKGLALIRQWTQFHWVRMACYAVSWISTVALLAFT